MISDPLLLTLLLAAATFSLRYLGVILGQHLPASGPWTRALNALPGCLLVSLVIVILSSGGAEEWIGASIALFVAIITCSLPLTMVAGIALVWALRLYT